MGNWHDFSTERWAVLNERGELVATFARDYIAAAFANAQKITTGRIYTVRRVF